MRSKGRNGLTYKIIEEVICIFFVFLGLYLANKLVLKVWPGAGEIRSYKELAPYIFLVSIVFFYFYDIVSLGKSTLFESALSVGLSLMLIDFAIILILWIMEGYFSLASYVLGYILQFTLIYILKLIVVGLIRHCRKPKDVMVIASREESSEIIKNILKDRSKDNIKYICYDLLDEVYDLIDKVDNVYIGNNISQADKTSIMEYCLERSKTVMVLPGFYEINLLNSQPWQISDYFVLKVDELGLTSEQRFIKRAMDIVLSFLILLIMSPVLLVVALAIKLYDGGPVFYKQERVTEGNKTFDLLKFRSMIVDAEKLTGPVLATESDPRITPIGRLLRAARLDEFPQFINVLKGDMSIVGPRPERPFFVNQFNKEIEVYKYRTYVKAGITGLAQVAGRYATDPETKAKYDLYYIKNYSFLLDLKIIFNTVKVVFIKERSQGIAEDKDIEIVVENINEAYEEASAAKS